MPLFFLILTGCTTVREYEPLDHKEQAATVEAPADSICQERPGRTAVTVRWTGAREPGAVKQLPVLVTNTSPMTRSVTLLLAGTSPNGQHVIEQEWSEFALAAGEERSMQLPLDRAPIQSTVRPSGLSIIARFTEPGAAAETEQRVAFTEPLLVTHAADFSAATVRSLGEQRKADAATPSMEALLQATFEVRVRNEKTGAMLLAEGQGEAGDDWSGTMVVRKVSPEEVEASLDDPHTPETNVLPHDGGPGFKGETL